MIPAPPSEAGDIGHFNGGVMNLRDCQVPDPGVTFVPSEVSLNLRGFGEFASQARFQGWSLGLNLAKKF